MHKAIILHGTGGSPEGNWFRWLERELKERGYEVWLPALPGAELPSLHEWAEFVAENCPFNIDDETLIIGHSSGAILALILAQQCEQVIGGIVAVSVFYDNSLDWDANARLFDIELDYDEITINCDRLLFIHSDNDPYVPLQQAEFVTERYGGEIVVVQGGKHFNIEASEDYRQFPLLVELLEERGMV